MVSLIFVFFALLASISAFLAINSSRFLSNLTASAQSGQLRGQVLMAQDGKEVPVAGAQIDVYRTDIAGKYNTKTDKKGDFVFAGLPFVGT